MLRKVSVIDKSAIKYRNEKFKLYCKNSVEVIDTEELAELPRLSKGKRMISTGKTGIPVKLIKI